MQPIDWILGDLPIGVWVASVPDGQAVYVNRAFNEIIGVGVVVESRITDAPATYGIFDRLGNPYPVEKLPFSRVVQTGTTAMVDDLVIHRPDGKRANVRAFAVPHFDDKAVLTNVIVAFVDATKEVRTVVERDTMEGRLSMAVDHSAIVIWSMDRQGIITLSEGAGLAALGVKSGQLVGQNLFDLYKDHPTISGYVRRGLQGESLWYTVQVGEAIYDTWLAPLRDAGGEVSGVVAVSNDVGELRRLQAAAIQNDRVLALGTLAASVAHEINNPLTYMLMHAEQLASLVDQVATTTDRAGLAATMREHLNPLRIGTERVAAITRELRTFNHPDDSHEVPVDVRAVVTSVLQLVGKELEATATLVVNLNETPAVSANHARLVQVVLNLIMNAMQAFPTRGYPGNEIGVRTIAEAGRVCIEISDTGTGIPPGDRERLFDPFVTTKRAGEGTGLGLFVSRNIVRGYQGDVTVADRPGGGSIFRVSLLEAAGASSVAARPTVVAAPPTVDTAHILIVDDDPLVADVLAKQLRRAGYRATVELDGARALEILAADDGIDLVFCDLMMRGMTGMDLALHLKVRAPKAHRKMVFMTGGAFTPEAKEFFNTNPDQIVEKPFDVVAEAGVRLLALQPGRAGPEQLR